MLPLLSLLVFRLALPGPAPKSGEDLIREMRRKYDGRWYTTVTFTQKTTRGDQVETWYEAAQVPGLLRIDIAPLDSGKALLFRNDSVYQFRADTVTRSDRFVHPLMVLGFDVYLDSAERTIQRLKDLKFDLSLLREDSWQGRPVYVVGAAAGDTIAQQFWVDRERLVFVRMLETGPRGNRVETQFNGYQPLGGGWIETEVLFMVDGELRGKEEYSDIRQGMSLEPALFDPAHWGKAGWIGH